MQKIPTVFVRNPDDRKHVLVHDVTPGCEWVLDGENKATRKFDGTCTMCDGERWWARREVKPGKVAPDDWIEVDCDVVTGKRVGWEPIEQSPFAKFHAEALAFKVEPAKAGTYELVGPKINGNPEGIERHTLIPHGFIEYRWDGDPVVLMETCRAEGAEGVVWHHPDGRMAKLKVRDIPASTPRASSEPTQRQEQGR